jgi:hypothetical protein
VKGVLFADFYVRLIDKICDWCDEATANADLELDILIDSEFNTLHVDCVVNNNFVNHSDANFHSNQCNIKVHKELADSGCVYNDNVVINGLDISLSATSVASVNSVYNGQANSNNAPLYNITQPALISYDQG